MSYSNSYGPSGRDQGYPPPNGNGQPPYGVHPPAPAGYYSSGQPPPPTNPYRYDPGPYYDNRGPAPFGQYDYNAPLPPRHSPDRFHPYARPDEHSRAGRPYNRDARGSYAPANPAYPRSDPPRADMKPQGKTTPTLETGRPDKPQEITGGVPTAAPDAQPPTQKAAAKRSKNRPSHASAQSSGGGKGIVGVKEVQTKEKEHTGTGNSSGPIIPPAVYNQMIATVPPPHDAFALTAAWLTIAPGRKLWGVPNEKRYNAPDYSMIFIRNLIHQYAPRHYNLNNLALKKSHAFIRSMCNILVAEGDNPYRMRCEELKLTIAPDNLPRPMTLSSASKLNEEEVIVHLAATGFNPSPELLADYRRFARHWLEDSVTYSGEGHDVQELSLAAAAEIPVVKEIGNAPVARAITVDAEVEMKEKEQGKDTSSGKGEGN
ncbi:hypothetical protein K474DRAFT_1776112 [Panus rudis PR-1116 ss-1]|nr:hypothetical protein K474DRAFT_1702312 [Panus rudis PR-1116 ss-1]KAI0071545.1 hypothetical protein K474DRAFT_1776112 [Panus rudis PR-1116 ss-1]